MLALVEAQADITIAQLRDKILAENGVAISWTLTQNWVKRLGLRLRKSRSTPSSETRKQTV
jgi:transposase